VRHRAQLVDISRVGARLRANAAREVDDTATLVLGRAADDGVKILVRALNADASIGVSFDLASATEKFVREVERLDRQPMASAV
jgi:hypothetical protein